MFKLVDRSGSRMMSLKSPHLQAVDVEVLLSGEWLVIEGCTFSGSAPVQFGIEPQSKLPTSTSHLQRVNIPFDKVRVFSSPAIHLDFWTKAVEEGLPCAVEVLSNSKRMS